MAESDLQGNITDEYIFFNGNRIARRKSDGTVNYYFADHLGSSRVLTSASGTILDDCDYFPFGGETSACGSGSGNHYKFTDKERDGETGLDYFGARYYSSVSARWMSPDPYNPILRSESEDQFVLYLSQPQNWNRYVYALNDPLGYVDPNGENVYVIAYTTGNSHSDDELRRAAETKATEIQNAKWFDANKDTVLLRGVNSKQDLVNVINEANSLEKTFGKVEEVSLFAHSGPFEGPVFHGAPVTRDNPNGAAQMSAADVKNLPRPNWSSTAKAFFYGCKTTNFARLFARTEDVTSYGTSGNSYFSSRSDRLAPDNGGHLYLIDTYFNRRMPNRINGTSDMDKHKP